MSPGGTSSAVSRTPPAQHVAGPSRSRFPAPERHVSMRLIDGGRSASSARKARRRTVLLHADGVENEGDRFLKVTVFLGVGLGGLLRRPS